MKNASLANRKFLIREVAEIHDEKPGLLQSWADKNWARITPAPGPGQARELTIVDVYSLSIAVAFTKIGVNAQVANQIAFSAVHYGETLHRATGRTWRELRSTPEKYFKANPTAKGPEVTVTIADVDPAFRWRELSDPYHLFAKAARLNTEAPLVVPFDTPPHVDLIRIRNWARKNPDGLVTELTAGALSDLGFFMNLTELLYYVDRALNASHQSSSVVPSLLPTRSRRG